MGRLRPGTEVPVDLPPRADPAGVHDHRAATARKGHRRPRSTRCARAACTTTSAVGSPATRPTASGSSPTSRRCCTTRRCSSASTARRSRCSAAAVPTGRRGDDRVRPARPAPPRRRLLLRRGRRLARRRRPRRRGLVPHLDPRRGPSRTPQVDPAVVDTLIDWFGHHRRGQLRGPVDPEPPRSRAASSLRPPEIERRVARLLEPRVAAPAPGSRRQGAHRVECPVPPRRSPTRPPSFGAPTTGSTPRSPTASSCCGELRDDHGRWYRSWQADGDPRRATTRSPPITPRWSTRSSAWPSPPVRHAGSTRP